jgi:alanyl-tRNA synthetase
MTLTTTKLYLKNPYIFACRAKIIEVSPKGIVTDRTIAFPEGGGQEGDHGLLGECRFTDTQKGIGRTIYLENFPVIQVNSPIYHVISQDALSLFRVGMDVNIKIDIERRAKLTVNHSGLHVVLMGIEKLRPGITLAIVGCSITPEYARIDFSIGENKFTQEDLNHIREYVNEIISSAEKIKVFPHSKEEEAWYWKCRDVIIPCGGTHLESAKYIGEVCIKRKNMGKNTERIIATFPNAQYCLAEYHEE